MTTQGFNWEGLLRAMEADISGLLLFLLVVLIMFVLAHVAFGNENPESRKGINILAIVVVLAYVVVFIMNEAFSVGPNRLPRADTDKAGVYEQMDSNIKK